jgi:hypothetical protein
MREIYQENSGSLWHFDLLAREGKYVMFVSSASGGRRVMFENSAGLAKTISNISALPIFAVFLLQYGFLPHDDCIRDAHRRRLLVKKALRTLRDAAGTGALVLMTGTLGSGLLCSHFSARHETLYPDQYDVE